MPAYQLFNWRKWCWKKKIISWVEEKFSRFVFKNNDFDIWSYMARKCEYKIKKHRMKILKKKAIIENADIL